MASYRFQVLNVFAESTFGGNPLAVFEDARGLSDVQLQSLADQLNLAETTFIFPERRVRIFSPGYEMAFAGHPTLGTAYVLRELQGVGDAFSVHLKVGPVDVTAQGDRFEFRSPSAPTWSAPRIDPAALAEALGIGPEQLQSGARFVSTGLEQLMVPLRDVDAVRACRPSLALLPRNAHGTVGVSVFARETEQRVVSRFFWEQHGELREDAGTGSAAANLGGWHVAHHHALPIELTIEQGHAMNRLNVISLRVDAKQNVFVGGRVVPLMRGEVTLP